jgi:hypothetical protein
LLGLEVVLAALFFGFGINLLRRTERPVSNRKISAPALDTFFSYIFLGIACVSPFALMVQIVWQPERTENYGNSDESRKSMLPIALKHCSMKAAVNLPLDSL